MNPEIPREYHNDNDDFPSKIEYVEEGAELVQALEKDVLRLTENTDNLTSQARVKLAQRLHAFINKIDFSPRGEGLRKELSALRNKLDDIFFEK